MLVIDWDVELGVGFDVTKFEFSLSITELNRLTTFDVDKTVVGILFNDFVVLVCEWAANTLSEDVFSFWKLKGKNFSSTPQMVLPHHKSAKTH